MENDKVMKNCNAESTLYGARGTYARTMGIKNRYLLKKKEALPFKIQNGKGGNFEFSASFSHLYKT